MTAAPAGTTQWQPIILRPGADERTVAELSGNRSVAVIDEFAGMREQFQDLLPSPATDAYAEDSRWVFYPWRRTLIHLPGPMMFRRLRTDRNRNKITTAEQAALGELKIGVVGLSVGHAIAHTLALEGLAGELRLADFDQIELSNLNRVPATVFDVGINKAVVAARRIAELDPYLTVRAFLSGIDDATISEFFEGLDLVIEECDSLDIKVRIRQEARDRRIPVFMETSDRGLFDVERFDQQPERPLFHNLLGQIDIDSLKGLATRDKAPHVMRILQATELSPRMAASMVEIDRTLSTWPQLGGDVQLGAATVAAAVRRLGRGQALPSGRIRVDLESDLDSLGRPLETITTAATSKSGADLTQERPPDALSAVVHAIRLAPSGGNVQPWSISLTSEGAVIHLARQRTSAMDVHFRASYVAIGAAGFNARVAAAQHGTSATVTLLPDKTQTDTIMSIRLHPGHHPTLAALYPAMVKRISNRNPGSRQPLTALVRSDLAEAAQREGADLCLVSQTDPLAELADVLAESDRIRYLTPLLHQQMMSEIKWPEHDRLDLGIDVRTLGLDETDLAKLEVAGRPEVMKNLADWNLGQALGDNTRDRVNGSSAIAVISVRGTHARDYLRGGAAMERIWITAEQHGLGVQPISPVFLYARDQTDIQNLTNNFAAELSSLQEKFIDIAQLGQLESPILVMRLNHDTGSVVRSERLSVEDIMQGAPTAAIRS